MVEYLRPLRERYADLSCDPAAVDTMLADGADAAEELATGVLQRVRTAVGLLPRLDRRG